MNATAEVTVVDDNRKYTRKGNQRYLQENSSIHFCSTMEEKNILLLKEILVHLGSLHKEGKAQRSSYPAFNG